jgi:hypothetical protein
MNIELIINIQYTSAVILAVCISLPTIFFDDLHEKLVLPWVLSLYGSAALMAVATLFRIWV